MAIKEHDNRKNNNVQTADELAEYITGQPLRKYLARKVKQYAGDNPTLLDGAAGSGQLAEHIDFKHLTAVEVQPESCEMIRYNYPGADVWQGSFFQYKNPKLQVDCAIMNPPYSLRFKNMPDDDQDAIQADYPWKTAYYVDDIFVLKAMEFSKRYGVFILFPGVAYRQGEETFRKKIGTQLVELNTIRNGFDSTQIDVIVIVLDKFKTDRKVKREIFECKTEEVVFKDSWLVEPQHWQPAIEPEVTEPIDIDQIHQDSEDETMWLLESYLKLQLFLTTDLGVPIEYPRILNRVRGIVQDYELEYYFKGGGDYD